MTTTKRVRWSAPAWSLFAARYEAESLADDLPVTVDLEQMGPARILHLGIGSGHASIAISLGKKPNATFTVKSTADGAACVSALAAWLGVPVPGTATLAHAAPPPVTVGVIDMGRGKGGRHVWQLVQIVLRSSARFYLIWRVAGNEAFICEHESGDREQLINELTAVLRDGNRAVTQPPPSRIACFVFDGEPSNVVAQAWARKLHLEQHEIERKLEAAGREHVDPLYAQIETALEAWPDDPRGTAIRVMKIPVSGCVAAVWGAIAHRDPATLSAEDVAALRDKLRSLAAADYVQRLYHQDEVHALLLR